MTCSATGCDMSVATTGRVRFRTNRKLELVLQIEVKCTDPDGAYDLVWRDAKVEDLLELEVTGSMRG